MKRLLIIVLILLIVTAWAIYEVLVYRTELQESQKLNQEYTEYLNVNFLGTQLISIINRTIDINEKNDIQKDEEGNYIENEKDSIKIYIQFIYKEQVKTIEMENITANGTESFIKRYSTAVFKCSKIEYHEQTHNVKSLTFEEIQE